MLVNKKLISALISIHLTGCATLSSWFAEEPNQEQDEQAQASEMSQNVIDKSNEAELEIDPNATLGTTMVEQREQDKQQAMADMQSNEAETVSSTAVANETDSGAQADPQSNPRIQAAVERDQFLMMGANSGQVQVKQSKQRQIATSVDNDYYTFQALNHKFITNNTAPNQYRTLNRSVSHFVMDLVAKLAPKMQAAPLVVRPMKIMVEDIANSDGGKELITNLIASEMQDYGFQVFDGRRPKGRFSGDELILETMIESYGEQFVLYGTLRQLSDNKVAGTHQAFISDYFFRNIQDGVEVYRD